jgi:hypothetical protein
MRFGDNVHASNELLLFTRRIISRSLCNRKRSQQLPHKFQIQRMHFHFTSVLLLTILHNSRSRQFTSYNPTVLFG